MQDEVGGRGPGDPEVARPESGRASADLALTRCPNCGTHRIGGFRFCRVCGLDFDVVEAASSTSPRRMVTAPPAARLDPDRQLVARERAVSRDPDGSTIAVGAGAYRISMRGLIIAAAAIGVIAGILVALVSILLG
jgi:hypothetical protein